MPKQTKRACDHRVVVPISWQEVASYATHSMQCSHWRSYKAQYIYIHFSAKLRKKSEHVKMSVWFKVVETCCC